MTEAEQIMKRCQAGTRNYEEANNLHAACYGMIGKLLAQPEQEPVVCCQQYDTCLQPCTPRGEHLAQRKWVGLTDEQIWKIATNSTIGGDLHADKFAQAIEAKLKEFNDHSI
jgi:hypothetical protein